MPTANAVELDGRLRRKCQFLSNTFSHRAPTGEIAVIAPFR